MRRVFARGRWPSFQKSEAVSLQIPRIYASGLQCPQLHTNWLSRRAQRTWIIFSRNRSRGRLFLLQVANSAERARVWWIRGGQEAAQPAGHLVRRASERSIKLESDVLLDVGLEGRFELVDAEGEVVRAGYCQVVFVRDHAVGCRLIDAPTAQISAASSVAAPIGRVGRDRAEPECAVGHSDIDPGVQLQDTIFFQQVSPDAGDGSSGPEDSSDKQAAGEDPLTAEPIRPPAISATRTLNPLPASTASSARTEAAEAKLDTAKALSGTGPVHRDYSLQPVSSTPSPALRRESEPELTTATVRRSSVPSLEPGYDDEAVRQLARRLSSSPAPPDMSDLPTLEPAGVGIDLGAADAPPSMAASEFDPIDLGLPTEDLGSLEAQTSESASEIDLGPLPGGAPTDSKGGAPTDSNAVPSVPAPADKIRIAIGVNDPREHADIGVMIGHHGAVLYSATDSEPKLRGRLEHPGPLRDHLDAVLHGIRGHLHASHGAEFGPLVVVVPLDFSEETRNGIARAARNAQLRISAIVDEPRVLGGLSTGPSLVVRVADGEAHVVLMGVEGTSTERFKAPADGLAARTVQACEALLNASKTEPAALEVVWLDQAIGNIEGAIRERFGCRIETDAEGSAARAAVGIAARTRSKSNPSLGMLPLSIGYAVGRRFRRLIGRDTPLPTSNSRIVRFEKPDSSLRLLLFQGEHRDPIKNEYLGTVVIEGADDTESEVELQLEIDAGQVLQLGARQREVGDLRVWLDQAPSDAVVAELGESERPAATDSSPGSPLRRLIDRFRGESGD